MSDGMLSALADARWPEVERARRGALVVPLGSLEQHGPHLPLDTDSFLAVAVAERVHQLRPEAGLAPVIPFGASGEHADFPGTLSIGSEAVATLLVELVRHASHDWGGVLIVNGHGGNGPALAQATALCRYEKRQLDVVHLATAGMDAHAGQSETSLMLHLAPGRVRLDLAEAGATAPISALLPHLREHGVRAVSPNGVLGDPTRATAAAGAVLFAALVESAVRAYDSCRVPDSADGQRIVAPASTVNSSPVT